MGPMADVVEKALERIGRGDFDSKIEGGGPKDVGRLGEAFEQMIVNLKDQISKIEKRSFDAGRSEKEKEISLVLSEK